jgi:hypothetical protein
MELIRTGCPPKVRSGGGGVVAKTEATRNKEKKELPNGRDIPHTAVYHPGGARRWQDEEAHAELFLHRFLDSTTVLLSLDPPHGLKPVSGSQLRCVRSEHSPGEVLPDFVQGG